MRWWSIATRNGAERDLNQLLTLWGLEHARAAQKLARGARAAIGGTWARRSGREAALDADRASGGGAHGGAEVGGPAAGGGGHAGAGRGEARHVLVLLKELSGEGLQVDVESELARIKQHVPGCVQRCLDKTSGACRSREWQSR